jgi:hypothetical protein
MKLYVYNADTREVAIVIDGPTNAACEAMAESQNLDPDLYEWTYSPAFGFADGLIDTGNHDGIQVPTC